MHTVYTIPMLRLSVHSVHQCAPPISLMDEEREGVWGYPGMPGWGVYFCVRILQCLFLLHVCRVTVDLMRVAVWACCLCLAWACYHDVFCSTVRAA